MADPRLVVPQGMAPRPAPGDVYEMELANVGLNVLCAMVRAGWLTSPEQAVEGLARTAVQVAKAFLLQVKAERKNVPAAYKN